MDTLTGTFFPLLIFFPGGKKCLNLGSFSPGEEIALANFSPRGNSGGGKSACYTGLKVITRILSLVSVIVCRADITTTGNVLHNACNPISIVFVLTFTH